MDKQLIIFSELIKEELNFISENLGAYNLISDVTRVLSIYEAFTAISEVSEADLSAYIEDESGYSVKQLTNYKLGKEMEV